MKYICIIIIVTLYATTLGMFSFHITFPDETKFDMEGWLA